MSLYAITTELSALLAAAEQHGDESEEFAAALAEHAALMREALADKADSYAALVRSCEVRAEARQQEAKRMQALADSDQRLADRLRAALLQAMQETETPKIETARFRLAIRANGGKLPVVIDSEADLPADYRVPKVTLTIDRDSLREALEAGEAVPGARLGVRGTRLDIK